MNGVLRKEIHDTFFHRDCPGGTMPRTVAEGMVECSFFLPTGNESDVLPEATLFLNLRGDGSSHTRQMDMLTKVASTIVVITNSEHLTKCTSSQNLLQGFVTQV